jgi:hypothetical protein
MRRKRMLQYISCGVVGRKGRGTGEAIRVRAFTRGYRAAPGTKYLAECITTANDDDDNSAAAKSEE